MNITDKLAEALRCCVRDLSIAAEYTKTGNPSAFLETCQAAREALAAYDAQQAQTPLWTVFIRDEDNTGTTYITCVAAADLDAAKGLASAQCRDDWGYEEDAPLHILGVIEGDIGAVIEWDDCE